MQPKPVIARRERPYKTSLQMKRSLLRAGLLLVDIFSVLASYLMMGWLYLGKFPADYALLQAELIIPIMVVIGLYNGTYSLTSISNLRYSLSRVIATVFVSSALLIFLVYFLKELSEISRVFLVGGMAMAVVAMSVSRFVFRSTLGKDSTIGLTNTLVIHDDGPEIALKDAFHLNAAAHGLRAEMDDPASLHNFGNYVGNMDRVIVSCCLQSRPHWTALLRAAGVDGEVVSETLADLQPIGLRREHGFVSLVVSTKPLGPQQRFVKRVMDLLISTIAVIALSPVLLLAALAIKLEDGGPVFFVQQRMGEGNKFFDMLKFRSMAVDKLDASGQVSTQKTDPRITRVGAFLRKTSIDELPQLLNVFKGDMSLVGPRPHALGSKAGQKLFWEVDTQYWHRHSLKPGLTGLAQVRGLRGATDLEDDLSNRLRADLEYISNWSPINDLVIMAMTLRVLVHERAF